MEIDTFMQQKMNTLKINCTIQQLQQTATKLHQLKQEVLHSIQSQTGQGNHELIDAMETLKDELLNLMDNDSSKNLPTLDPTSQMETCDPPPLV